MNRLQIQNTAKIESAEERMIGKNLYLGAVSYNPMDGKIYECDARDFPDGNLPKETFMIDVDAYRKAKVLGASGEIDKLNKLKIFSEKYLAKLAVVKRILKEKENTYAPLHILLDRPVGASGAKATTDYETIRRDGDLLTGVIGQEHTNEDYQAINIAEKVERNSVRFEYIKRTSSRIIAQKMIGDDNEAMPLKHTYTTGTKDIFAYGLQFISSIRDNIDTKTNVLADFTRMVPDSILAAKNEDVITLLNALNKTNQGDWDAFTSGVADVDAATQVQVGEDAVKAYGRPLVAVMNSDAWRGYQKNQQGANITRAMDNIANRSTSQAGAKTGELLGNPGVTYYIDDALTAGTYVLAAKPSYMKYFQAMVVMTSFQNVKTPGKAEQRFWYDFAGFEETLQSAAFGGSSVLA